MNDRDLTITPFPYLPTKKKPAEEISLSSAFGIKSGKVGILRRDFKNHKSRY